MGDHLKAVVYFRKALKLDRNCLAAWTLMGHEVYLLFKIVFLNIYIIKKCI